MQARRVSLGHRRGLVQLPTGAAGSVPTWHGEGAGASAVLRASGTERWAVVQSWPSSWAPAEHVIPWVMFLIGVWAKDNWDAQGGACPTAGLVDFCLNSPSSVLSLFWPLCPPCTWCYLAALQVCFITLLFPCLLAHHRGGADWAHLAFQAHRAVCQVLESHGVPLRPLPSSSSLAERERTPAQCIAYASCPGYNLAPSGCCCRQDHNKLGPRVSRS
jgi:hypothetical protein